jgi:murein DD-endopeptidase MepM/ murein hydrolase activator NlpD
MVVAVVTAVACGAPPPPLVRTPPDAPTRGEYAAALAEFGLGRSALGRDWIAAGERALAQPVDAATPFSETGYLAPTEPSAVAYKLTLRRGRTLVIDVTFESAEPSQLFIDLFELSADGDDDPPRRVAEANPGARVFEYEVRRDAAYVLRLQPELLRGGRYTVVQRTEATLAFPVQGLSLRAGLSGFGAPRDAGRRSHHGIDIFAPRGTPVLAAADGTVRVDTSNLGGQVIWLREASSVRRSLYYAHLDSWAVQDGASVKTGDVIGYVGNTGNARTTPPHLHFGVYERGPTDPFPFLQSGDPAPPRMTGVTAIIGSWARIGRGPSVLRAAPATSAAIRATLDAHTAVQILAASAAFYRVGLPDGTVGYVRVGETMAATEPLRRHRARAGATLHETPARHAPRVALLEPDTALDVLGTFGDFDLVRLSGDQIGWLDRTTGRP